MTESKLCALLGVKPDEPFKRAGKTNVFRVHDGKIETHFAKKEWIRINPVIDDILEMVQDPAQVEKIDPEFKLTGRALKICRILNAKYISKDERVHRVDLWRNIPTISMSKVNGVQFDYERRIATVDEEYFPGLKGGMLVDVQKYLKHQTEASHE